ncbi:VOC family protein [Streptomyces specialis]|uniref:VOC family protein n=1 Tax=Streptomyces specialis TaxID=498367 RepID=UPI00073E9456|nr:VOC family protein [Streptomyces specialis]
MITTDFIPGSPAWLDLGVPDTDAAAGFYGPVFGWEFQSLGPEAGGYGFFRLDGRTVAAAGPLTEQGARPAWMLYFRTEDADASAQAVENEGGTVRAAPTGVDGAGRMAQFTDPQGGEFAVWQPGENRGLEAVDQPGTLVWSELYTTDAAAAKGFYRAVFGWETDDMPLPGGSEGGAGGDTYTLVGPPGGSSDDPAQDRMHGGIMQLPPENLAVNGFRPYWHPVFGSADCDGTVASVPANGGSVQMGPEDAPGVGRLAVCLDPFGADFVVLTPVMPT